jgi:hypothetical protein
MQRIGSVGSSKAFTFTASGNNPSAKISTLREAAWYLRSIPGEVHRLLIVEQAPHPIRGDTVGRYFVRLNSIVLDRVTVLEVPVDGGDPVCIPGMLPMPGIASVEWGEHDERFEARSSQAEA